MYIKLFFAQVFFFGESKKHLISLNFANISFIFDITENFEYVISKVLNFLRF